MKKMCKYDTIKGGKCRTEFQKDEFNDVMYTYISIILLVGVGIYFTIRT